MNPLWVPLDDLAPGESADRAAAAREAFGLHRVSGSADPMFAPAWGLLHRYFGPKGEIERESVVRGWLDRPVRRDADLTLQYHLLFARAPDGGLAGTRDCYSVVDHYNAITVVYLAHALVAPAWRRSGLATLLRAVPVGIGRKASADAGLPEDAPLLLALEQEPVDMVDLDSRVRLVAYGRGGFQAIDPAALPYHQPDFRDLDALGVAAEHIPLLAVVRRVGFEGRASLPKREAAAFVRALYAVFASHCRPSDLAAPRALALDRLAAHPTDPALLPFPAHAEDHAALAPLRREVVLPLLSLC